MNPPVLSTGHVFGSPTTTFLGLAALSQGVAQTVAGSGLPTNAAGWTVFGLSALAGFFGIFGRG